MFVGFSSQTYTAFEMTEHVTVCVEVLNPPFGGAIKGFNVCIQPEEGTLAYIFCVCILHYYLLYTIRKGDFK